ncbi:complement C3-like, partial [Stegodyphus dumicola]|uniref:complement C3-like n=1 Tax=Stegodyphus dumicola TaxID=202533 RepID=UPI0015ABBF1C
VGNKNELSLSLPHSITTWVIQAVSVSQTHGICVAEPKKVLSFKKIFLQLDLPYSVVRNEQVEIPATIFNYGHKRLSVIMYMYGVEHLCTGTKKDEKSERKRLIVEGQSAVTATFPVIPLKEGEFDIRVVALSAEGSDAIMRKLHVVPEGYPDGIDFSIKLDPSNMQRRKRRFVGNNRYTDSIDESQNLQVTAIKLHVPQDFVPGTESCVITALGDQLGPAVDTTINNPDKLLTKPRGCGEQNMMFLAPTLYTMRYLKVKGKITPEVEEKGYGYIRQGYGNQLAFRKEDGSYAAYQHKPTSTWLTAFVMKVFCQANELIHIDENVLCSGIKWLIDDQQPDGSYIESHPMYHLDMMGGVQGKTPMTAFALIALEECKCDAENLHLAKKKAVAFLEQHLGEVNEALPVAIVAYALALGESDLKDAAHDKLLTLAMHDEDANMLYWDTGNPARNIEATAYGLLNLLLFNDMMRSASIVNWLNSQQLQSGSFQSTQDTVIALQALAEYAIRAQMPPINLVSNITSSNDRNFHKVLAFHEGNSMVLQDVEVRKIGGTLFINTAGHGVGSLSVKLRYNVNRPPEQICKFDVTVNVTEATGEAKEADPLDPQLGKLDPLVPSNNDVFNLLEADLIRGMGQALDKDEDAEPVFVGDPRNRQPASLVAAVPEKEIRVKRENAAANSKLIYKISICARYLGDKTAEMSIVDVGLFSGFEPEERDLELLQNSADGMIQRYEKSKRGIVFYLQTVPRDNKYCFSFHVTRQFTVGGTQASVIKVYDYYSPGYSCTVFYSPASNSPLLHTICEGGICQCAEGGCPPNEPFEEIRKIHSLFDRREKLLDAACENYHYVWKGKVLENTKKAGIFLNITFFIEKVIKEGTEKAELIEGETRTLLLRDTCASSEPFPNSEYLIMGKDGQKYKDDNDQIWHRYMLDKNSVIYLWNSLSKAQYPVLQRDLNHVTRKLEKNGCNG